MKPVAWRSAYEAVNEVYVEREAWRDAVYPMHTRDQARCSMIDAMRDGAPREIIEKLRRAWKPAKVYDKGLGRMRAVNNTETIKGSVAETVNSWKREWDAEDEACMRMKTLEGLGLVNIRPQVDPAQAERVWDASRFSTGRDGRYRVPR